MNKEKNKPIRILQYGLTSNYGGMEAVIMSVYRRIDRTKIQFDFLTSHNGKVVCEEEITKLGGRIFRIEYPKRENLIKHYTELNKFFKKHANEFQGVHMNRCSPNYSLPLKYAKKYGIPIRIFHSHNTDDMYKSKSKFKEFTKKVYNEVQKIAISKRANFLFACSDEAGKYMFNNKSFTMINNGIEISKFRFSAEIRNAVRTELGIDGKKVIGFVGRLQEQKNPFFALDVFKKIADESDEYILLMIGSGILEESLKEKCRQYHLENKVYFLGARKDVNRLYQAMDVFFLPSLFEGLAVVLIEAQATGLPCITSSTIPRQSKMTDYIYYIDLKTDIDIWSREIQKAAVTKIDRKNAYKEIIRNHFDIQYTVDYLTNIYLQK